MSPLVIPPTTKEYLGSCTSETPENAHILHKNEKTIHILGKNSKGALFSIAKDNNNLLYYIVTF